MATKKTTTTTKKSTTRKVTAKKAAPAKTRCSKTAASADAVQPKKLSAVAAAALVLAESPEPLTTRQMVEAMSARGFWTSPEGKTPHATLYAAILREIQTKGKDARFRKVERGKFAANA